METLWKVKILTVQFSYAEDKLSIQTVSLHIYIDRSKFEVVPMSLENSIWQCDIDLPPGEHLYKFAINEEMLLCDSCNNLFDIGQDHDLWSLLLVDENEDILINPKQYYVTIIQCHLSTNKSPQRLGAYQAIADEKISVHITCTNVTGIHLLTAAWYTPDSVLYEYSESPLCADQIDEHVSTMFWIERDKAKIHANTGLWTLRLFLDGRLILSDKFSLLENNPSNNLK